VCRVQDTRVEHRREGHDSSAGSLRDGGALVQVSLIRDLDHPIERSTSFDRRSLAVREDVRETDPAMTTGLLEGGIQEDAARTAERLADPRPTAKKKATKRAAKSSVERRRKAA
jgi:hypothetical protein